MTHTAQLTSDAGKYSRAWQDKMVQIWRDRIQLHGAVHSGSLLRSVRATGFQQSGLQQRISFQFLQYGIYVDAGSGPELARMERNQLGQFTAGAPRRKPKPWFSPSWAISQRVMADEMQRLAGDAFVGLFADL